MGFRGSNASSGCIVLLPGAFWAHNASKMATLGTSLWAAANGGVTNGGLRGVWPPSLEIGRNRPKSPFFCLFRPFPAGAKSTWEIQKTEEKGLFPQISSDFLKPPSLKPPFAALQSLLPCILQCFRAWEGMLPPSACRRSRASARRIVSCKGVCVSSPQRALRGVLMPRGKNWLPTVSRQLLTRN